MDKEGLIEKVETLAKGFHERSAEVDRLAVFPHENFKELKESGYLTWTIPKKFGGLGLNLYEFLQMQERIARGDGPTALSVGWHLGSLLELAENETWEEETFAQLCEKVVTEQALINRAATERGTGSPTRGGRPETEAEFKNEQWTINGRKAFTSMAEALDYSLVTAVIAGTEKKGIFLVDHRKKGVSVEETWDSASMKGTRSDDLVLENVKLPSDALVEEEGDLTAPAAPKAWLLHIPACYLGIATAARDYAVEFANNYQPNSLPGPIKEVAEVQMKIGEIELELFQGRELLYSVANRWISEPEKRPEMGNDLAAVKHVVTNMAVRVVDLSMRIVGARSLSQSNPLERYYRDVRSGLHNPPMDDMVIKNLAKSAFSHQQVLQNQR
ncbi:acyl-CoA dehydrogenase family protein [Halobacillus seohaensis]|uniref:Acyl-CoA dehydrogenase family protein n=1 Tax=Halobacillus seohaensis TaxID=447421 RepID=A0ABW2EL52_9BACI